MLIDELNKRVTEHIFRAEHAEENSDEAMRLYREISVLEYQISMLFPADSLQGALSRIGAVTAALKGNWKLQAMKLASSYLPGAPPDLTKNLLELLGEDGARIGPRG
jgi:hypothetical protein